MLIEEAERLLEQNRSRRGFFDDQRPWILFDVVDRFVYVFDDSIVLAKAGGFPRCNDKPKPDHRSNEIKATEWTPELVARVKEFLATGSPASFRPAVPRAKPPEARAISIEEQMRLSFESSRGASNPLADRSGAVDVGEWLDERQKAKS